MKTSLSYKYYLVFKPYKMLCQFSTQGSHQTLASLPYTFPKDVYPVGRLDADSEGLIILSNDKKLVSYLFDNQNPHPRTYLVQVEGIPSNGVLINLQHGVTIRINGKMYKTKPCKVELLTYEPQLPQRFPPIRYRKNTPTSWLKITLFEGKNRQIRRMTAAVGYPTLRLVRIAIGQLTLNNMLPGEIKEVPQKTIYTHVLSHT